MTDAVLDTSEMLLAALDPEQREVALATRGAVCVLAGAGTGKTRAITYRIAYAAAAGMVNPAHVLALTFTVRAAGELRGRLRQLSAAGSGGLRLPVALVLVALVPAGWGPGWCGRPRSTRPRCASSTTSGRGSSAAGRRSWSTPRPAWSARRPSGPASGWRAVPAAGRPGERCPTPPPRSSGPRSARSARTATCAPRPPRAARRRPGRTSWPRSTPPTRSCRRERHLIDFESVLELTAAILIDNRAAADQVRDTFRHFVVDEYQDVNPLQKLLLDTWLGDRDDLCVVGDPHQVIYSFTGATPSYLTGFTAEFPGATVVRLVRDYRSTPQVVAVANQLAPSAAPLVAQRPPGPRPVLTEYPDDTRRRPGWPSRSRR